MLQIHQSPEITEENHIDQQRRWPNLVLNILTPVTIDMPPNPAPSSTPKRVNFSPLPSPRIYRAVDEPLSPSPSNRRGTMKSLLPKLSFKYRNNTADIEKAAILALEASPMWTREKPSFSRSFSLSKMFSSKMKSSSSPPVTPIAHSNPESMHGRGTVDPIGVSKFNYIAGIL